MQTAKFLITRRHVSVIMLWVNASTSCFSCLREHGFSLYTSALAAIQKSQGLLYAVLNQDYAETIRAMWQAPNSVFKQHANGP